MFISELAKLATALASPLRLCPLRKIEKASLEGKKIQKQKKKEGKMKNVWEQNTHHDLYE